MGNVGEYYVGKKLLKKIGSAQIGIKKNNTPHLQGLMTKRLQCGLNGKISNITAGDTLEVAKKVKTKNLSHN